MVILIRGLCAVAAAATASLLAVMAIDATVTIFSSWPRWVLTFSAVAATAVAAVWFLARPLARSFTMAGIARAIEARHPELQERISSAVELMSSNESEEFRGSRVLIDALVQEACRDVSAVAPRREVTLRSVRPFFYSAVAFIVVLAGLLVLWPRTTSFLLERAVAPYMNLANVQAADMKIRAYAVGQEGEATSGDLVVQEGQRIAVEVEVSNRRVNNVEFRIAGDTRESVQDMRAVEGGSASVKRFSFTYPGAAEPALSKSFRYRIRGGDAISQYFSVMVVPARRFPRWT